MSVAVADRPATVLRVRPAPDLEPPFDDETGTERGAASASSEQRPRQRRDPGPVPDRTARRPPVPSTAGSRPHPARPQHAESARPLPQRPERAGTPPRTGLAGTRPLAPTGRPPVSAGVRAAHRYASLCVEVLAGFRPVRQLQSLTAEDVYDLVCTQLSRPRPGGGTGGGRRGGTGATGAPVPPGLRTARLVRVAARPTTLRHVRVSEPATGVAEAAAVVERDGQVWAMALRLEQRDAGWLCTYLRVL